MTMNHTPEPWKSGHHRGILIIYTGATIEKQHFIADVGPGENQEANAARIVACVNALRGIPEPEETVRELRKQFAALTVLIDKAVDLFCEIGRPERAYVAGNARDRAKALLAKLEPKT